MNRNQLWNSILQQAISGKLVPQLDSEPEVEQIGAAPKPDEVPFELPPKWKWVQLEHLFSMQAGKFIKASLINDEGLYPCYGGNGLRGYVDNFNVSGTFNLIGRQGALCGNVHLVSGDFYATEHAVVAKHSEAIDPRCAYYFLTALNLNQYATATAQPGLAVSRIKKVFYPLAPLSEQRRIVAMLEEIRPLVERFGEAQERLVNLEAEFPIKLKASVLQQAIKGKLVPQLDSEPEVVQVGPAPKPDEVPFELPAKWKWIRLGDLAKSIRYGYTASAAKSGNAKFLRITDLKDGDVNWTTVPFCDISAIDLAKLELGLGDVVIARSGATVGKSFVVEHLDENHKVVFASYLIRVRFRDSTQAYSRYIGYFLNSPTYWTAISSSAQGTAQPNVNAKQLANLLVPVPPLEEQCRIVAKLDEVFAGVEKLGSLMEYA